jgi:N-acetylglucosamine-6-sulfatase
MRIPLVVRYPGLTPSDQPRVVKQVVLTTDFADSILDICGVDRLPQTHGGSWVKLAKGESDPSWRTAFLYHYNYEKQFPYTPNVRAVRGDRWKFIRYPHGDGGPDRHKAELFDMANDPDERRNLIDDPQYASIVRHMESELARLLKQTGAAPDKMPLDEGVKQELPDEKIR